MRPRPRGGRAASASSAAPGRQSTRIAAQTHAAQQAAGQAPADEPAAGSDVAAVDDPVYNSEASLEASVNGDHHDDGDADEAVPESSMPPPPSSTSGRGIARGRGEQHAQRGTRRVPRAPILPSIQSPNPAVTTVWQQNQPDARDNLTPHTLSPAVARDFPREETPMPTPRTNDAAANLMNKFVDRLLSVSRDLLSHLALEGPSRDESWVDELRIHKDIFSRYYRIYNLNSDVFIDIDVVSHRTRAEESPFWPRMTKAVATANLANLLGDIEDLEANPIMVLDRLPLLQSIDEHFPTSFVPGGKKGLYPSVLDDDTTRQAFHIRTQRYIETLRGVQNAVPTRLFARVFLDIEVNNMDDNMLGEYIDTAQLRPFAGFDINDASAQKHRDEISGFRSMLVEMDANTIISKLEEEYPFHRFLEDMKNWIRVFEANIKGSTRPPTLNGDGPYTFEEQLQQDMRAAHIGKFSYSAIERLRHHMKNASTGEHAHVAAENASSAPSSNEFSLASTDILAAQRARDLSQAAIRGEDGTMYAAAAAEVTKRVRKRGRKSGAEDDTASKRARAADASAMPPPRQNAGGAIPHSSAMPDAVPGLIDVVAMSRASQLISKANRKPAQPKQRKPWTAHDTQQLVRAVNVYKAKWSTIEKAIKEGHIPFNVPERDQQGLRDKARLVKVDILKTDSQLPPGFDLVVLGRKEKDMVIAAGRNPERKEHDNDPDQGSPRNTLFEPQAQVQNAFEEAASQDAQGVVADAVDNANLRALQEAHMQQPEAPIGGGAPTAPMLAQEEITDHGPSESLGEFGAGSSNSVNA